MPWFRFTVRACRKRIKCVFLQISVRDYGIPIKKEIDNLVLTKRALSRIVLIAHFVKLKSSAWFMLFRALVVSVGWSHFVEVGLRNLHIWCCFFVQFCSKRSEVEFAFFISSVSFVVALFGTRFSVLYLCFKKQTLMIVQSSAQTLFCWNLFIFNCELCIFNFFWSCFSIFFGGILFKINRGDRCNNKKACQIKCVSRCARTA